MRRERKDEHIDAFLEAACPQDTLLRYVHFEPTSFPELAWEEVDTSVHFMGKKLKMPLLINAMTGGTERTGEINRQLARLAHRHGIGLQLGSMRLALEDPESRDSFCCVREFMDEEDLLLANLGMEAEAEEVSQAMAMIQADGIGIHVNTAQEVGMREGRRDFRGGLARLAALGEAFPSKIILKQVGFGFSQADCDRISCLPVTAVDISGAGGSNFMAIEDCRRRDRDYREFYDWGVPTALSLLHGLAAFPDKTIIASGGLKTATDMIRCLVLGADLCAMSGELLRRLLEGGYEEADRFLSGLQEKLTMGMLFLGCRRLSELKAVACRLEGPLAGWEQSGKRRDQ